MDFYNNQKNIINHFDYDLAIVVSLVIFTLQVQNIFGHHNQLPKQIFVH